MLSQKHLPSSREKVWKHSLSLPATSREDLTEEEFEQVVEDAVHDAVRSAFEGPATVSAEEIGGNLPHFVEVVVELEEQDLLDSDDAAELIQEYLAHYVERYLTDHITRWLHSSFEEELAPSEPRRRTTRFGFLSKLFETT